MRKGSFEVGQMNAPKGPPCSRRRHPRIFFSAGPLINHARILAGRITRWVSYTTVNNVHQEVLEKEAREKEIHRKRSLNL